MACAAEGDEIGSWIHTITPQSGFFAIGVCWKGAATRGLIYPPGTHRHQNCSSRRNRISNPLDTMIIRSRRLEMGHGALSSGRVDSGPQEEGRGGRPNGVASLTETQRESFIPLSLSLTVPSQPGPTPTATTLHTLHKLHTHTYTQSIYVTDMKLKPSMVFFSQQPHTPTKTPDTKTQDNATPPVITDTSC